MILELWYDSWQEQGVPASSGVQTDCRHSFSEG